MGLMVREAKKTQDDFNIIIKMAENHPAPEYDCPFSEWVKMFRNLFLVSALRAWIAFENDKAIGYVIGIRENSFRNQISVFDIYFEPDFRGMNLITLFFIEVRDWAVEDKAKRIQWTSKFDASKWMRILQTGKAGIKVDEYKTLTWEVV
jgi:hypothetical protein